jgi:hypothetical protein
MLKDFYKSPNGYFRLGTLPGGYPPGTTPRPIEDHFGDPDEQDERARRRLEAEEDKADEERKLRRRQKAGWRDDLRESQHFGENHTNNNERKQMTKLKFKYPKRDDIPADHVPFYVEVQDGWQLDADGAADTAGIENLQNRLSHAETEMNEKKEQYESATATHLNERKKFEERIAQLEKNRGTGAQPALNSPPAGGGDKNPFSSEHFNLTKQSQLVSSNPEEAARLQAQAKS